MNRPWAYVLAAWNADYAKAKRTAKNIAEYYIFKDTHQSVRFYFKRNL